MTPRAVVNPVSDVMSELAPLAAAPKFERAPEALEAPVPPFATVTDPDKPLVGILVNPEPEPLKEVAVTAPAAVIVAVSLEPLLTLKTLSLVVVSVRTMAGPANCVPAVMVPPTKLPDASRSTSVLG